MSISTTSSAPENEIAISPGWFRASAKISLGDLSKYLGVNQVTLSRIRSKK